MWEGKQIKNSMQSSGYRAKGIFYSPFEEDTNKLSDLQMWNTDVAETTLTDREIIKVDAIDGMGRTGL